MNTGSIIEAAGQLWQLSPGNQWRASICETFR